VGLVEFPGGPGHPPASKMTTYHHLLDAWKRKWALVRDRPLREVLVLLWRKLVYRRVEMGSYGVRAGDSQALAVDDGLEVSFLHGDEVERMLGTSPHLTREDIERFRASDSVCIVVRDGQELAANSWMSPGDVYVTELRRTVQAPSTSHLSSRTWVEPDYRGRGLMSRMIHAYSTRVAAPDDEIWGLVYDWNVASVRSLEKIGWEPRGCLGTIFLFGFLKIPVGRRGSPA